MKSLKLLSLIICTFLANLLYSQTPYSLTRYDKTDDPSGGFSAYSPYLGIKTQAIFSENELSTNFVPNISLLYTAKLTDKENDRFRLPFFGNFSLPDNINLENVDSIANTIKEVFLSEKGVQFGLYPYYILNTKGGDGANRDEDDGKYFVMHGELSLKWNGFEMENQATEILRSTRMSFGFEYGKRMPGGRYISSSLTGTYSISDEEKVVDIFGTEDLNKIAGVELSVAVPLFKLWEIPVALGAEVTYDNQAAWSWGLGLLTPIELSKIFKQSSSGNSGS